MGLEADPPVPPPRGLLPLLDFKRLPDRALAAARKVVTDDDAFRRRVRDATSEESVGRASWLFLDRPESWSEELARLAAAVEDAVGAAEETKAEAKLRRRVTVLESSLDRTAEGRKRLEAELTVAKEQLADERRARRLAESDAGRRRREADSSAADLDELRRRHSLLQQAMEGAAPPPPSRSEKPAAEPVPSPPPLFDHAGLSGFIADAARAAEVLSRALDEAEQLLTPALEAAPRRREAAASLGGSVRAGGATRRQPTPLPPGTFDDSVEAAGHLVRMAGVRVLVDGYNVTKSARPELTLVDQRQWLADAAVELAARTGARIELVFDGADERASAPADLGRRLGVQLRFSAEGIEADDVLLDLVEKLPQGVPVVVASDDRRVREGARQRGANVLTTAQVLTVLGRPSS